MTKNQCYEIEKEESNTKHGKRSPIIVVTRKAMPMTE